MTGQHIREGGDDGLAYTITAAASPQKSQQVYTQS